MSDWFTEKCTIGELVHRAAERHGDGDALVFDGRRWTWADYDTEVDRAACMLLALGIEPGDKVALWLMNSPEWLFTFFGAIRIGASIVPLNTRLREKDVEYCVTHSNAKALVQNDVSGPIDFLAMTRTLMPELGEQAPGHPSSAGFPDLEHVITVGQETQPGALWWPECVERAEEVTLERLRELEAAVDPDEPTMILYTSGTTGFLKGVMHSHRAIRALIDRASRLGTTHLDSFLCNIPLFHLFGLSEAAMMAVATGSKLVLTETFDPDESVQLIERERVTFTLGFDVHYAAMIEAKDRLGVDVSSIRIGHLPSGMDSTVPIAHRVQREFCATVSAYGLTESWAMAATGFPLETDEQRCETSGFPMPGYEVKVVDGESGESVPNGEHGEILVRGYLVMLGYYKEPEKTAETIDSDGWLHTGDMGFMRDDGYVRFLGRYKDMLKVGGENVSPMEVEGFLLDALPLELVAVVGQPDERLGEVPIAFVVPRDPDDVDGGALEQQVLDLCKGKIASFKIPRRVFVIDDMPMTASGKIQKVKLRDRAAELLAAS